jgi:N-formylglutamate deformylase
VSELPDWLEIHRGDAPLIVSFPHTGTELPESLAARFVSPWLARRDADWWVHELYAFVRALGATTVRTAMSRSVIDVNRAPDGHSLYPGQTTTGLCPTETFRGVPLYKPGHAPDAAETQRRVQACWQPYHQALRDELHRLRALHGRVLLWEAHSIASVLPRLFDGTLPDLNFGTNGGATCDDALLQAVLAPLAGAPGITHVVNGRFKGGWITRCFGRPADGVHAVQLEMCQHLYMNEAEPFEYREAEAARIQPLLQRLLAAGLAHLRG